MSVEESKDGFYMKRDIAMEDMINLHTSATDNYKLHRKISSE